MASVNGKEIAEVSTLTNTFFNALKEKQVVKISGIVKSIDDKQTPFAVAKRFKGEFYLKTGTDIITAKYLYLPDALRDLLISGAAKLGKWSSFEFVVTLTKNPEADKSVYSIVTILAPRPQKPAGLALLDLEAK